MFKPLSLMTVKGNTLAGRMDVRAPVVAYWDLETMKADWRLFRESRKTYGYIDKGRGGPTGPAMIACSTIKYLGNPVIMSTALKAFEIERQTDKRIVWATVKALAAADIIVAYNQKGFDLQQLQTRAADYNIPWIGEKQQRDPMTYVKANLDLHSNAMGDVAERYGAPVLKGRPPYGWADKLGRTTITGKRNPDMSVMPGLLDYNMDDVRVLEYLDQHFLEIFPDYR